MAAILFSFYGTERPLTEFLKEKGPFKEFNLGTNPSCL